MYGSKLLQEQEWCKNMMQVKSQCRTAYPEPAVEASSYEGCGQGIWRNIAQSSLQHVKSRVQFIGEKDQLPGGGVQLLIPMRKCNSKVVCSSVCNICLITVRFEGLESGSL